MPQRRLDEESLRRENRRLRGDNERLQRLQQEQAEQIRKATEQLAKQEQKIADQKKELAEKDNELAEKDQELVEKSGEIADLERQLGLRKQNSTNSSKPPSSDGVAGEQRERGRKQKKSRRKPGGQPGHLGHCRQRVPLEQVDETQAVLPSQCRHCEQALTQTLEEAQTTGQIYRHQIVELPVMKAHVSEYRFHEVLCPGCRQKNRAAVPPELQRQTGPRLTALVAYLTVVCRMPRRVVGELLEQALGIDVSLGNTQTCWEEASEAVAAPCQELEQELRRQPVLNIDETGWRTNGDKRFLWAFVAAQYVVYRIAPTRGSALLMEVLGAVFAGILGSDRFSAYSTYHQGQAQFCWAHLKRNILGVLAITKKSSAERFCRDALALHARLFRLWHKFKSGQIDRTQLCIRSVAVQGNFLALAEAHLDDADRQVQNLAHALFINDGKLFTFLKEDGVEPTNNSAERALRTGVQWRKICFGNRSGDGELATARLLTVSQTCRVRKCNSLQYLTDAISQYRRALPAASLLKG